MRSRLASFGLAALVGLSLLPNTAGGQEQRPSKKRLTRLWGLQWSHDLDHALARAQRAKKPVLWLRMLGDLDGFS